MHGGGGGIKGVRLPAEKLWRGIKSEEWVGGGMHGFSVIPVMIPMLTYTLLCSFQGMDDLSEPQVATSHNQS